MKECGCSGDALMPIEQALARMFEHLPAPLSTERVALDGCVGRVLAETLHSPTDVPAWDNSAMDGYALRAADWQPGKAMPLAGRVAAGQAGGELPAGHAVRIFTGAPLPAGADTVVAQEDCSVDADGLLVDALKPGSHVRRRGEEVRQGDALMAAGTALRAMDVALLASRGVALITVHRKLRVGLVSSGDELRAPGEQLAPGQIHNANHPMLRALLSGWGCEVIDAGTLPDCFDVTQQALGDLAGMADVIVSSGGVSVGDEDHLKHAVSELGNLRVWRLAIQPGKPLAFGDVRGTPWTGLPGNPVAALVTALMVARPWLWAAMGRTQRPVQPIMLPASFDWHRPRPRQQFLRACITGGADGSVAVLHEQQGSAMLSGASWAQGLVDIEPHRVFDAGAPVRYWPFSELLY